ncbi:MAG: SDR family NAD(P)-dependent oxidoreductase [Actinomycetota bacterium]|jgi:NAD(P)-dependent dehydrogenase (short-subunit alcohol dehydrogenase family)|nr:SDR family NAD(P)-dependent oxidoreductase [Actinomycetota bacterium]
MADAAPEPLPSLPSMRLDGQVALVTGAGRGIGAGCAAALAQAGAQVVAMSRTQSELDFVVDTIRSRGGTARAVVCDVTDTAAMQEAIGALERVDVLVNNAGVAVASSLIDLDEPALDLMLDLNCRAAVLVAQSVARAMVEQGSGVIINLSSTFGKNGRPNNSVYSATKHFIEGFTKSAAVELAPRGVRVVGVGPTAIDTPLTHDRLHDPAIGGDLLARIPLGRFGQVEDVVGAVVFLATPAASLITGTTLMVDGGWTAQ